MDSLLKPADVAAKLNISERTLERLILQGKAPPHIKLGRMRRWHPDQLDAWINTQFSKTSADAEAMPAIAGHACS